MAKQSSEKFVAVYTRVSSKSQTHKSQLPDLKRWADAQELPVKWYKDTFTGKSMERPGWSKLETDLREGKVSAVVVWRLDRLGRTAKGLTALFSELQERGVGLVSLKDGLDLSTPAGRLMAHVLASVAQYETELRAERVLAGQAKARAEGKTWGGRKPGTRIRVDEEREEGILTMYGQGKPIAEIARVVGVSRPTIYNVLAKHSSP